MLVSQLSDWSPWYRSWIGLKGSGLTLVNEFNLLFHMDGNCQFSVIYAALSSSSSSVLGSSIVFFPLISYSFRKDFSLSLEIHHSDGTKPTSFFPALPLVRCSSPLYLLSFQKPFNFFEKWKGRACFPSTFVYCPGHNCCQGSWGRLAGWKGQGHIRIVRKPHRNTSMKARHLLKQATTPGAGVAIT